MLPIQFVSSIRVTKRVFESLFLCMGSAAVAYVRPHRQRPPSAYYPLRLAFSYVAYCDRQLIQRGVGETVEISSASVRVNVADLVDPDATQIRLSIAWPATLEDGMSLQFVVQGTPVWVGQNLAEIVIVQHEFRTAPRRGATADASTGSVVVLTETSQSVSHKTP